MVDLHPHGITCSLHAEAPELQGRENSMHEVPYIISGFGRMVAVLSLLCGFVSFYVWVFNSFDNFHCVCLRMEWLQPPA